MHSGQKAANLAFLCTEAEDYSSSSALSFPSLDFWTRLTLAAARSSVGKTRSKTSEYQATGWPSRPSLMFYGMLVTVFSSHC